MMNSTKHNAGGLTLWLAAAGLTAGMALTPAASHAASQGPAKAIASTQEPTPVPSTDAPLAHPPRKVAGVPIPGQAIVQGHTLRLNGAGLRKRFVFDVYVAALYAERRTSDADALIQDSSPRRLQLILLRDIDSKTLSDALNEGLNDNTSPQELASLRPATDAFLRIMNKAGQGKDGDIIDLDISATGVAVSFRGTALGAVQDPRFGPALLRVWLGHKPAQKSLKKALLGQE